MVLLFREMNAYTNISLIGYDLIVQKLQKPFEVRVAIKTKECPVDGAEPPTDKEIDTMINYLGDEGFLDGEDEDWDFDEPTTIPTRLAVGWLPPNKFKELKHKVEQNG